MLRGATPSGTGRAEGRGEGAAAPLCPGATQGLGGGAAVGDGSAAAGLAQPQPRKQAAVNLAALVTEADSRWGGGVRWVQEAIMREVGAPEGGWGGRQPPPEWFVQL